MGKTIGLTYNLKTDWVRGPDDPCDVNAELDKPHTIERIIRAFESGGHTVKKIGNVHQLLSRLESGKLDEIDVDIVFNICEGTRGRNRESQVPMLLELKGIPYVGADALTMGITLDKVIAKKMFISEGIPTARYFVAESTKDLERQNTIGYPLIVKTIHEGSSKGISQDSRVEDLASLTRQVHLVNTVYKQPALVEEFIRGTEFTVAVLGNEPPRAMPIVQVSIDGTTNLGDEFYTFERISSANLQYVCPAKISDELTRKIQDLAARVYKCVGCRDFGRVDFRVDQKGNPYVLEINPLPSMDPQDSFSIFPKAIGSSYDAVLNQILYFALKRYGLLKAQDKQALEEISLRVH